MRKILSSLMLAALVAVPAIAGDPCGSLPQVARRYLTAHPGWHVLTLADLSEDDRTLWMQYHKDICPGVAEVDFDGSGGKYTALALIHRINGEDKEQVVAIRPVDHSMEEHTIMADFPPYCVIWRAAPGVAKEWDSNKKVRIAHDSLIVETLESSAQQYYWKNGSFHYLQTSD